MVNTRRRFLVGALLRDRVLELDAADFPWVPSTRPVLAEAMKTALSKARAEPEEEDDGELPNCTCARCEHCEELSEEDLKLRTCDKCVTCDLCAASTYLQSIIDVPSGNELLTFVNRAVKAELDDFLLGRAFPLSRWYLAFTKNEPKWHSRVSLSTLRRFVKNGRCRGEVV